MIIIKYDANSISPKRLREVYNDVCLSVEDLNEKVICVPLDIEILYNCSIDILKTIRDEIDEAIDAIEDRES